MLYWTLAFLCLSIVLMIVSADDCYDVDDAAKRSPAWKYLEEMRGQKINVTDSNFNSTYTLGICTNVLPDEHNVGVAEFTQDNETIIVGRINASNVMSGSHWILLTYTEGQPYSDEACGNSSRQAALMFICNHNIAKFEKVKIIDENLNRQKDCYHLFEIEHCLACIEDGCDAYFHRLSPGSYILIGSFSLMMAYLIFGWLYQRCIAKQTGWQQIPNAKFWQELGHLQADGCAFACRCGTRPEDDYYAVAGDSNNRPYQSNSLLSDDDDDNLLPP